VAVPVLALALTATATLSRHQRVSLLEVVQADYVRTARAKGVSAFRVTVFHALRNAVLPTVTLAGFQFPTLLGGAFVIEEVFGIRGMGWETLRAIEAHDTAWIVATVLLSASVTTAMLIGSDVALGALDPRVRERQLGGRLS
jgi:peptide/nickel transport system permease protein